MLKSIIAFILKNLRAILTLITLPVSLVGGYLLISCVFMESDPPNPLSVFTAMGMLGHVVLATCYIVQFLYEIERWAERNM